MEVGCNNSCPPLCLHFHNQTIISDQNTNSCVWRTVSLLYTLTLISCVQTASGTCAQLPAMGVEGGGYVVASELRAEIDWKLPQFTTGGFLWKLEGFNRLQSSKVITSDRSCQCNYYLGGERDSWCSLLHHLPRILLNPEAIFRENVNL